MAPDSKILSLVFLSIITGILLAGDIIVNSLGFITGNRLNKIYTEN